MNCARAVALVIALAGGVTEQPGATLFMAVWIF
jgi:hypothetical protein